MRLIQRTFTHLENHFMFSKLIKAWMWERVIMLLILKICLICMVFILGFDDVFFLKDFHRIGLQEMTWKSHPRRGKCLKTHYFGFVVQICAILVIKIQFPIKNSAFISWFINLTLLFLFSRHFCSIFAQKSTILAIQNIFPVGNSIFMA